MSHTTGVRQAQKQQSRRALMDAALQLLEHQSFSSLGMREVTREAGMSPAGFYRHFRDLADLGVALVEEALDSLHAMVRAAFAEQGDPEELIDHAVQVIADHVREHRAHVRFIARERFGGVRPVREAIDAELARFTDEVAAALAAQPVSAKWSPEDIRMVAQLYVDHMVLTAAALQEADAEGERRIAATARRQLRLISLGRHHWMAD
ncbi:TetR family transcriptional regulator [Streptacidiphilus pinicola]|uniref:TetR family transcriptional regulator n=1 Tax=Streptacidiphilus pinicola TaxID=2219663 RepID=A0A2X0IVH2_9ACTN|nr:TetR family transcriptional regulator [Streptacidiphilus pinicola]RAG87543.1 TetR family transcriptional regulator [Streptacidiphilus pinicola]